jgi:Pantoate-beta-alanine ligase.
MCARYRKGHFEGVIDVMDWFTKIINPQKIFIGRKRLSAFFFVKKFI